MRGITHWLIIVLHIFKTTSFSGFNIEPSDSKQSEGEQAYFNCIVKKLDGDKFVSWLHNGRRISKNGAIEDTNIIDRFSVDYRMNFGQYSLRIQKIQRIDKGEYICTIYDSNDEFVAKSRTANFTVLEIPRDHYPLCSPIAVSYVLGEKVTVSCTSERTSPLAHLIWKRDNVKVSPELVKEIINNNHKLLHSFNAKKSDNRAIFVCELTTTGNPSVKRNCSSGPINILYPPNVRIQQTSDVVLNKEAIFICYSDANPQDVLFEWNFEPVIDEQVYMLENDRILRIKNAMSSLNGTKIMCRVTNSIGSESATAYLNIKRHGSNDLTESKSGNNKDVSITNSKNQQKSENKNNNRNSQYLQTPSPEIENDSMDISISRVVFIAVLCIIAIIGLALIPVGYMKYSRRQPSDTIGRGRPVSIPDVYFEPRDHLDPMLAQFGLSVPWMRTVGVQAPGECEYDETYTTQVMPQLRQVYYSRNMYPADSL